MTLDQKKNLILLQLNELNFNLVKHYVNDDHLNNFKKIIEEGITETFSENKYELLEPWIQWVSVNTGKSAEEHGVFRLGDMLNSQHKQFYEILEENGNKVGAVAPMNTVNNLNNAAYFISDPWTKTKESKNLLLSKISNSISKLVNNNSSRTMSLIDLFYLLFGFLRYVRFKKYIKMVKLAVTGIKYKWRWAIFLDIYLNEIHLNLLKNHNPNFSSIFLNCGAHIQHHYLCNNKLSLNKNPSWYINEDKDPFREIIKEYDDIILEYKNLKKYEMIIATGLSQAPCQSPEFYYRLNDHCKFLDQFEISYSKVMPRMTRDFLILYDSENEAKNGQKEIEQLQTNNGEKLFGIVDNRGTSLFVSLTYNKEITAEIEACNRNRSIKLKLSDYVSFVALKNGIHSQKGYAYLSDKIGVNKKENFHVKEIFNVIINYFNIEYLHE